MSRSNPSLHRLPRPAAWRVLLAGILCFATAVASAQEPPPAAESGPNLAEFSEAGQQAFQLFEQEDYAGAIEVLEGPFKKGQATHVDLALLGTLYLEQGRAEDALGAFKVVADSESADPAVLYNAGRAALALGDVAQAEQYLERSLLKVPFSPATRDLGLLRNAQGRVTEAFRFLRPWVMKNPGDLEARIALISAGLQMDRAADVGPLLQGLPEGDPRVELLRGEHLNQTGDHEGALKIFEAVYASQPPEELRRNVHGLLAKAYLALGRGSDVVKLLEGQVGRDLGLALLLAQGQQQSGDSAGSLATLAPWAEAVAAGTSPPGSVTYQVATAYGVGLTSLGRPEEALAYLQKATELAPRQPAAWKALGDALTRLGRTAEAQEALDKHREIAESFGPELSRDKAIAQDPGTKAILDVRDAMSKGETQRALAILRQEIALAPNDVRARALEIRLLITLQRLPEALKSADAAVEAFPDNGDVVYQRGVIYMAMQNQEAAERDLRRALELVPDHVPAMNDLAILLSLQGKKEEAKALLERLVELSPDNALALENLKKMRQGSGG